MSALRCRCRLGPRSRWTARSPQGDRAGIPHGPASNLPEARWRFLWDKMLNVFLPWWKRVLAVLAPVWATILGAAMAVQWELGAGGNFASGPPGAHTVGRWMVETFHLMDGGEPLWWWRGPFFLSLVAVLPFAWWVTGSVGSRVARWCTRGGLLVGAAAIGLEYSTPGYGWLFDLVALLVALGGTVAVGVSALRQRLLPRRVAWSLIAALPLTPAAGFLVFWYMPPGLTIGLLIGWALAAILMGREPGLRRY